MRTISKTLLNLLVILLFKECVHTGAVSIGRFNANIREFADNNTKKTTNHLEVRTLQKQEKPSLTGRIFTRENDPLSFQVYADSDRASSSHGRGFQFPPQNEYTEYSYNGYEGIGYAEKEPPVIEHYYQEPHHHEPHYPPPPEHGYQHHGHDNQNSLAFKTFLLPLAGIALLGAAAALATNPVLLQLGVISGRRRRRAITPVYGGPLSFEPRVASDDRFDQIDQRYAKLAQQLEQSSPKFGSRTKTRIQTSRIRGKFEMPYQTSVQSTKPTLEIDFTTPHYFRSTLQRTFPVEEVSESSGVTKISEKMPKTLH